MKRKILVDTVSSITLTNKSLNGIINHLEEWMGFRLTQKGLLKLLNERPDVAGTIAYSNSTDLDTVDRETLMDELAYNLVGRQWPCNSESSRSTKLFMRKFEAAAKRKKYL